MAAKVHKFNPCNPGCTSGGHTNCCADCTFPDTVTLTITYSGVGVCCFPSGTSITLTFDSVDSSPGTCVWKGTKTCATTPVKTLTATLTMGDGTPGDGCTTDQMFLDLVCTQSGSSDSHTGEVSPDSFTCSPLSIPFSSFSFFDGTAACCTLHATLSATVTP